jgi:competence ComEA-like helix-hairpin-helix protein
VPTANEKKALWFLAFVALSGSSVRLWRAHDSAPASTESAALERQIRRVDSVRDARHKSTRKGRVEGAQLEPGSDDRRSIDSAPGARMDLDRATADQIESLPGIGPALAKRIVDNRDSSGSFGVVEALCDVRGVGPTLVERLRPLVTFTGPRRHLSAACGEASKRPRKKPAARGRE